MARDAVTITSLVLGDKVVEPTGVTISVSNGAYIDPDGDVEGLFLEIDHTTVSSKVLTVPAGDYPPAWMTADQAATLTASKRLKVAIEGAKAVQDDGTINIDFATGMTGTIWAYRLPKSAR